MKDEEYNAPEKATIFVFKTNKPENRKWEQGEVTIKISKKPIAESETHNIFKFQFLSGRGSAFFSSFFDVFDIPFPFSPKKKQLNCHDRQSQPGFHHQDQQGNGPEGKIKNEFKKRCFPQPQPFDIFSRFVTNVRFAISGNL